MTSDRAPLQTAQVLSARYGPAYRWLVTITGMIGVVSMVLAMTTVNVAVPDVMGAFGIGQDKAQWMSSAYTATMTAGMLMNAWVTGVLGERRTFVGSLAFFSLGAVCTHLGCLTAWKPELGIIACPCHGSKFQRNGEKIAGPAPKSLPWLRTWVSDDGDLMVDRGTTMRPMQFLRV